MQKYKTNLTVAITLIALVVFMAMGGCKKEDAAANCTNGVMDGNETGVDCGGDCKSCQQYYIKTINFYGDFLYTYFYDAQHRVDSVSSRHTGIYTGTKYTYQPGLIIEFNGSTTKKYYLNSNGYAETIVNFYPGQPNDSNTYSYDADGHLIATSYEGTSMTWQTGNEISRNDSRSNTIYTYYTDKQNTIGNENTGIYYYGKSSVNLVKSLTSTGTAPVSAPFTKNFTYTYDSQNRVTSRKEVNSSGGSGTTTFTYY